MTKNNRIDYIDLAKGACILLVVFMHVVPELGKGSFLVNLRMPLYYFLSGLFFKTYDGFKGFSIKKVENLLIPFLAWYIISYSIYYIRVLLLGFPEHIFRLTDLFFEPEFYNGSLWFLLSLFWCNLLYYGVEVSSKNEWVRAASVLGIAVIGWSLSYADLHNFLYIGTSLVCLPFFYMGRLSLNSKIINNEKLIKKDLLLVATSVVILGSIYFLPIELPQMWFYLNELASGEPLTLYVCAISLIFLLLTVCKYIERIPYISFLGRYSIVVLVTHGLLNNLIRRTVAKVSDIDIDQTWFRLSLFFLIIAMMSFIIPLCKKYLPYICAQKSWIKERTKGLRQLV